MSGFLADRAMVVITGGSEGIGAAFARRYAAAGRDLLLIARRAEPLERLAGELRAAHSIHVATLAQDVTAPNAVAAIDGALAASGGYCDLLVNNAGIGVSGAFAQLPLDQVEQLVAVNVVAPTRLMHHMLTGMLARGRGGIINLSSLGAYAPGPYQSPYYASRAYILWLSEAVAAEVAPHDIRITAVAPGPVNTAFHAKIGSERDFYRVLMPGISAETVARWAVPAHKLGVRVVVPGLINTVLALCLKVLPHRLSVPLLGWLFRPRQR